MISGTTLKDIIESGGAHFLQNAKVSEESCAWCLTGTEQAELCPHSLEAEQLLTEVRGFLDREVYTAELLNMMQDVHDSDILVAITTGSPPGALWPENMMYREDIAREQLAQAVTIRELLIIVLSIRIVHMIFDRYPELVRVNKERTALIMGSPLMSE